MSDSSSTVLAAVLRTLAAGLQPGDRLPSSRTLVAEHGVSPATVSAAIAQLTEEGVVNAEPGRGTYVAPRRASIPDTGWQTLALGEARADAEALARLLAVPDPSAVVLSSGYLSDDLQPTRALSLAAVRAARRPGAFGRVSPTGLPELRSLFAAPLGADPAQVTIVPGGQAGLAAALRGLAPTGAPVLVEVPTYLGALVAARSAGLRPVPVPTDAAGLRPDLLAEAFQRTGAKLLYSQPVYANPTGASLSAERRPAVLDVVRAAGAFLLEDDWARNLAIDGPAPPPLIRDDTHGHVVYLTSLTKAAAPSLRIGALIAQGPAAARLRATRLVEDLFVPRLLQETALELLTSPAWNRHLNALRAALRKRRDALVNAVGVHLPSWRPVAVPAGGLHLWLRLPAGVDDLAVAARARADNVVIEAGRPYFVTEPPAAHVRLTYGVGAPSDLTWGVERLAASVAAMDVSAG